MNEFRIKQKRLNKIMKSVVVLGAIFIFLYIGVEPFVQKSLGDIAVIVCGYICNGIIIAVLITVFLYFSKYGKTDSFLNRIEHEVNDAGYYFSARNEKDIKSFKNALLTDLKDNKFAVSTDLEISDFDFDIKATKGKSYFYVATIDDVNREDILAHIDSITNDLMVMNLKRKGDVVFCVLTDKADETGIALSKMITPLGRKEQIKIAVAIMEMSTSRCYFLGNMQTKNQALIANYVMNCEVPIKEQYIGKEKLDFQNKLLDKMKDFNARDYLNGDFFAH